MAGYVRNVSPVKQSKDRKRKFFDFQLETESKTERSVCFSAQKCNLVKAISDENSCCEIKKFRRSSTDDIMIGEYSSVKKINPLFAKPQHTPQFTTISAILNECQLFQIVNCKGVICRLRPVACTASGTKFKPATIVDETGSTRINIGKEHTSNIVEKQHFAFTDLKISKYQSLRVLKTNVFSTIKLLALKTMNVHTTVSTIDGKIIVCDFSSFDIKQICPKCKSEMEQDSGVVFCDDCQYYTSVNVTLTKSNIGFTLLTAHEENEFYTSSIELASQCFNLTEEPGKGRLASIMMNSYVRINYDVADDSVIAMIRIEKTDMDNENE